MHIIKKIIYLSLILLLASSCDESNRNDSISQISTNTKKYINLTNLNLVGIQDSKHKLLMDELNNTECKCPAMINDSISLASCLSTNNVCSYSINKSNEIIIKYKSKFRTLSELSYSLWDAARVGEINGIYQHLIRGSELNIKNVNQETPLELTLSKNKIDAAIFILLSGSNQLFSNFQSNPNKHKISAENTEYIQLYQMNYEMNLCKLIYNLFDKVGWSHFDAEILSFDFIRSPTPINLNKDTSDALIQVISNYLTVSIKESEVHYTLYLSLTSNNHLLLFKSDSMEMIYNESYDSFKQTKDYLVK